MGAVRRSIPVRHGAPPPSSGWAKSGRPGSVPVERSKTGHLNGTRQETPVHLERAVHSARQLARPSDKQPRSASSFRKPNTEKREPQLPRRSPMLSVGPEATAKTPSTYASSGAHSTYALPKELKEELLRRKSRERELRQEREAREANERRQRALEADRAFRAWVAAKNRQDRGSRINSSGRDTEGESSSSEPSSGGVEQRDRQEAFEAWVRRKRRQQREEELRRRLRDIELGATERPRHSRHEAQLVYRAWLERKWEEERQRRLAVRAERRGVREAALSSQSLRLLERCLGSDEFARYPELVL